MEVITAMIQPSMLNKVTSALETINDFPGMSVSDAHGFRRKRDLRERRAPRIDEIKGKTTFGFSNSLRAGNDHLKRRSAR
jgi:nitrogen regulatory protein PII